MPKTPAVRKRKKPSEIYVCPCCLLKVHRWLSTMIVRSVVDYKRRRICHDCFHHRAEPWKVIKAHLKTRPLGDKSAWWEIDAEVRESICLNVNGVYMPVEQGMRAMVEKQLVVVPQQTVEPDPFDDFELNERPEAEAILAQCLAIAHRTPDFKPLALPDPPKPTIIERVMARWHER